MGIYEYLDANKKGKKEYRAAIGTGNYPYLPVLDDILKHVDIEKEVELGLCDIPLNRVVGTSTAGRTEAFARNFMPLLDAGTEFASKWSNLSDAQVEEGIRDPILVYEYLNRFYVVEGNKRVSVLKFFDAVTISANVIRKVPKRTDELENRIYYEFMDFYEITGINSLYVSRLGSFKQILEAAGDENNTPWDIDKRKEFNSVFFMFRKTFKEMGGAKIPIKSGDAFVPFITIYGYDKIKEMTPNEMKEAIGKIWKEMVLQKEEDQVDILMNPMEDKGENAGKKLIDYLLPRREKVYQVYFVYDKEPGASDWIYTHELGRNYVQDRFAGEINTHQVVVSDFGEGAIKTLNEIIAEGADIIFTVTPKLMDVSLKVAVEHPTVKILNCSLNTPHRYVRTYHGRMYEAKFLIGMIAGAMAENDKVGYLAEYPIYGTTSNINAFALGVKFTNPRAKVYLQWSSAKDYDYGASFAKNDIRYLSGQDFITPDSMSKEFGLYHRSENGIVNMAMPVWHWGIFYERLIRSVLNGSFSRNGQGNDKAYNYWWGISAGVIDIFCSSKVPEEIRYLVDIMERNITSDVLNVFKCTIRDQQGNVRHSENVKISPDELVKMDWLLDNVVGTIPGIDELNDNAREVVEISGVANEDSALSE